MSIEDKDDKGWRCMEDLGGHIGLEDLINYKRPSVIDEETIEKIKAAYKAKNGKKSNHI